VTLLGVAAAQRALEDYWQKGKAALRIFGGRPGLCKR